MVKSFLDSKQRQVAISIITYYEVLNYDFTPEKEEVIKEFLGKFTVLLLSQEGIDQSLNNCKSRKIKMADNFILATAQVFGLQIVTKNTKDFVYFCDDLIEPF